MNYIAGRYDFQSTYFPKKDDTLNQQRLIESIVNGFQKTPIELLISILSILGIVLLFILFSFFYQYYVKSKLSLQWVLEYESLIRKFNLSINELDLIDQLAQYLIDSSRKVLLLKNRNTLQKALSIWIKDRGHNSVYSDSLTTKLFGDLTVKTQNYPIKFISAEGEVFSGIFSSREKNTVIITDVKSVRKRETLDISRLFVQKFNGIASHAVSSYKQIDSSTIQLNLLEFKEHHKQFTKDLNVFVYTQENILPEKSHLRLLENNQGILENTEGVLQKDHAIKVSFKTEIKNYNRVNAIVTAVSLNKKIVKINFGYLNDPRD